MARAAYLALLALQIAAAAATAGCEIGTFDASPVEGTATADIGDRSTNFGATGGRDPRDLRIACERYALPQEAGQASFDTVHIGFADPLARSGRVTGVDLVVGVQVVD